HRYGIAQLLEVKRGDSFWRRQRHDLIVHKPEEVFYRLQLAFDQFDRAFEFVELRDAALQDFYVRKINAARAVVGRCFCRALGLRQLILNGLTIDRAQVIFAPTINVQKINEIFPALVKTLYVRWKLACACEL